MMGDHADYDACMSIYGPSLVRCAGDRLVVKGYICPHCQSTSPADHCAKPKRAARRQSSSAPATREVSSG